MSEEVKVLVDVQEILRKREETENRIRYEQDEKEREKREETLQKGRDSLWEFCRLKSPSYFSPDKHYLQKLINTLQAFYEKRIIKMPGDKEWQIVATTEGLDEFKVCTKLMLNIPRRHGKTRSLTNFSEWVFGKNNQERIIECSYNDKLAGEFAKFTRDGIQEERNADGYFVFRDFFPETKIKKGSSSYFNWALEGQFFNYLGAGICGSTTGKGGSILIIDDPIKSKEEAFNADRLQVIWDWYTGTFLQLGDAPDSEPLEIMCMTRWANADPCGRILESDEADEWYVFKLEAYDRKTDKMLCESVLSKNRYLSLKKKMIDEIFWANYHQQTIDQEGRLYKSFKTYTHLPRDEAGRSLLENRKNYTDTADEGDDYLCSINYGIYRGEAYILDVYYTREGMEITEDATGKFLIADDIKLAKVESNNGGRSFARALKRILKDDYKTLTPVIRWFFQSRNKTARIISNSAFVQQHIYFPVNWKDKWPEFYKSMSTYLKEGKNAYDDAEDAITGVAEDLQRTGVEFLK